MKKILATLVTAVVIGAGGVAVASAAGTPAATTSDPTTAPAANGSTAAANPAAGLRSRLRTGALKDTFKTAADTIGISPTELAQAVRNGQSIAQVATAHKVDPQKVIDAVEKSLDTQITQAETNKKITSDQAAKLEAAVAKRVPQLVNHTPKHPRQHQVVVSSFKIAADTIGVSPTDLAKAVRDGQSVAQVATAHQVDPQKVVDALVNAADKRIAEAVTNGKLDASRAAKLKARVPQMADRFVNFTRKAGSPTTGTATPTALDLGLNV